MVVYAGSFTSPYHDENQDSFWHLEERGFTVAAVADGAGSLEKSAIGADIAVSTSVNECIDDLIAGESFEESVLSALGSARKSLMMRHDMKDVGCTLVVAAMHEDGGWAVGAVGDAFAVVLNDDDSLQVVTEPKPTEFVNQTRLLTSSSFDPVVVSGEDRPKTVALSSDGLYYVSTKDGKASDRFWMPLFSRAYDAEGLDVDAFLQYMHMKDLIEDDTTLLIATPS